MVRSRTWPVIPASTRKRYKPLDHDELHTREQRRKPPQSAVVLRLLGQMGKPPGQDLADQAKELTIRGHSDDHLRDRHVDELGVRDLAVEPERGIDSSSAKRFAVTTRVSSDTLISCFNYERTELEAFSFVFLPGPCL